MDSASAAATRPCERSAVLLGHRPLVRRIASRLRHRMPAHVDADELEQAGMIGLHEAIARFEDNRGASFATYAARRIQGAMLDALRNCDELSRDTRSRLNLVRAAVQRLEHRLGRTPRAKEVSKELGWTLEAFHRCMADAGAGTVRHGDMALEPEGADSAGSDEFGEPHTAVDEHADPLYLLQCRERHFALRAAFEALDPRDRFVMEMIYDRGLPLREIGQSLGVSESRVSQLHEAVVGKLRQQLREW